jgi:hypothetical protein
MNSKQWTRIAGDVYCPVVVSAGARVVLFVRDAVGNLLRADFQEDSWSAFRSLGVPIARGIRVQREAPVDWQLSGCADAYGNITLFGRTPDGELVSKAVDEAADAIFLNLGAPALGVNGVSYPVGLAGPPAACGGRQNVDVFALSEASDLLHVEKTDGEWSDFRSLGLPIAHISQSRTQAVTVSRMVAACRCGSKAIAVLLRTCNGTLLLKWWDGQTWSDFASLGAPEMRNPSYPAAMTPAPLTGPPAVCSWKAGRLDVVARGPRGELVHKSWDGRNWAPFTSYWMPVVEEAGSKRPIPLTGSLAIFTHAPGQVGVVATALDGGLYQFNFNAAQAETDEKPLNRAVAATAN